MSGGHGNHAGWTDERVEQLKKLWAADMTCSEIAKQLGGVTRNAVIGKVTRLGLARRDEQTKARNLVRMRHPDSPRAPQEPTAAKPPKAPAVKPAARVASPAQKTTPSPQHAWRSGPSTPPNPPPVEDVVVVGMKPARLCDLTQHQCRWPLSLAPDTPGAMDETLFCGAAIPPDQPRDAPWYCPAHQRIAMPAKHREQRERLDRRLGISPGLTTYNFDEPRKRRFGGR